MTSSAGTVVDLNILQRNLGYLKRYIVNNNVTAYKALSAELLDELTTINTAIQLTTGSHQLSATPTLAATPIVPLT